METKEKCDFFLVAGKLTKIHKVDTQILESYFGQVTEDPRKRLSCEING